MITESLKYPHGSNEDSPPSAAASDKSFVIASCLCSLIAFSVAASASSESIEFRNATPFSTTALSFFTLERCIKKNTKKQTRMIKKAINLARGDVLLLCFLLLLALMTLF